MRDFFLEKKKSNIDTKLHGDLFVLKKGSLIK
jgi:hypothetical protein